LVVFLFVCGLVAASITVVAAGELDSRFEKFAKAGAIANKAFFENPRKWLDANVRLCGRIDP
jgi:hypothetical protein